MGKDKLLDISTTTTRWYISTRIGINGKEGNDIIVRSPKKDLVGHIEDVKEMIGLHIDSHIERNLK